VRVVDDMVSRSLWRAIRDVTPFAAARTGVDRPLWRVAGAPARGAELASAISTGVDAEVLYDWGGGLLWVLLAPSDDAGAAFVRPAIAAFGGMRR